MFCDSDECKGQLIYNLFAHKIDDFVFNKVTKILADAYFDFIGFVYSHELYDSDRYNHTKVIDIK